MDGSAVPPGATPPPPVPVWVIAPLLVCVAAALADVPSFVSTFDDAVAFTRIGNILDRGEASGTEVGTLERLREKFPSSMDIKIKLFAARLLSGDAQGAQSAFDELKSGKLEKSQIKDIDGWIEMASKRPVPSTTSKD